MVDGLPIKVEAAMSETLPVPVLLGTDVSALIQLLGGEATEPSKQDDVMVVVTRAQAQKQLEEETLRREKEVCSGVKRSKLDRSKETDPTRNGETLTKEQHRSLHQQLGKPQEKGDDPPSLHTLEISASELRMLQDHDETLAKVKEAEDKAQLVLGSSSRMV